MRHRVKPRRLRPILQRWANLVRLRSSKPSRLVAVDVSDAVRNVQQRQGRGTSRPARDQHPSLPHWLSLMLQLPSAVMFNKNSPALPMLAALEPSHDPISLAMTAA